MANSWIVCFLCFSLIFCIGFLQNYVFLANLEIIYLAGVFVALWVHYPIAIGLERALLCETKLQAIMSGCHPCDDLIRYVDDRYLGHSQPWSLGGAKATGNRPPKDLGFGLGTSPSATNLNAIDEEFRNAANGDVAEHAYEETAYEGTEENEYEEIQSDGSVLKRQISTTAFWTAWQNGRTELMTSPRDYSDLRLTNIT